VFTVPVWVQAVLVIGGLGVSAVLSGWLPKHPKVQRLVTAFALATVLAMSIATAAQTAGVQLAVFIQCGWWCWPL
jgi:hypothetical protein